MTTETKQQWAGVLAAVKTHLLPGAGWLGLCAILAAGSLMGLVGLAGMVLFNYDAAFFSGLVFLTGVLVAVVTGLTLCLKLIRR